MDNKRLVEEGAKKLAQHQTGYISKQYLLREMRYKMSGLDKAKNYDRWKALAECLVIIKDAPTI